jgi:hypothetical protein
MCVGLRMGLGLGPGLGLPHRMRVGWNDKDWAASLPLIVFFPEGWEHGMDMGVTQIRLPMPFPT